MYPGPDGPIDSIRWEVFAEAMQDYALLQTVGVERDAKLLAEIRDFANYPQTEDWRKSARRKLLAMGARQ